TLMCGFVGSFLTETYGWGLPFLFIGSMAMLWAAFVFQHLIIYLDSQQSGNPNTSDPKALNLGKVCSSSPSHIPNLSLDWCLLLKEPAFW
ncbi:hypothetical protein ACTXT7_016937, partial [Hymenolepis weldensis]